ncbi:MAG: NAD(P)-dependent oxidoreductase, partial [Spirochaetales bacterium]|nr:NAD(P)-dependent oxidoreductase [Spirochaetales bacterium]
MMTIAFIGCGRVGTSLAKYFRDKDLNVIGMNDRTASIGQKSAEFVGVPFFADRAELITESDVIFITVSDGAIPIV